MKSNMVLSVLACGLFLPFNKIKLCQLFSWKLMQDIIHICSSYKHVKKYTIKTCWSIRWLLLVLNLNDDSTRKATFIGERILYTLGYSKHKVHAWFML